MNSHCILLTIKEKLGNTFIAMDALFVSDHDVIIFVKKFYLRNRFLIDDVLDFREHKIINQEVTFDKFSSMYYNEGAKQAFEQVFYFKIEDEDAKMFELYIRNDKNKLLTIFNHLQENVNLNPIKLLLTMNVE